MKEIDSISCQAWKIKLMLLCLHSHNSMLLFGLKQGILGIRIVRETQTSWDQLATISTRFQIWLSLHLLNYIFFWVCMNVSALIAFKQRYSSCPSEYLNPSCIFLNCDNISLSPICQEEMPTPVYHFNILLVRQCDSFARRSCSENEIVSNRDHNIL